MSETPTRSRPTRRDVALITLAVALILGLAAGLRIYQLGNQSLWADEGNSAAMATRSFAQIAMAAANDIHPPLYYWLLELWTRVAGASEVGLRSFSAFLGILLVLVIIGLGMRLRGTAVGLVAGLIAALSPLQVYYSQEARMYVLLTLEAAAAVYYFWWLIQQEDRHLPNAGQADRPGSKFGSVPLFLIGLTSVLGLYTHYAFPVIIALLTACYSLWLIATRARGQVGRRVLHWVALLGAMLLCFTPWLGIAARQLTTWPGGGYKVDPWQALQTALAMLSLGPISHQILDQWLLWLLPGVALIGMLPWPGVLRRPGWLSWLLPVAWLAPLLAAMLVLGLFRDAYLKFLLIASPAYTLLLAQGAFGPLLACNSVRPAVASAQSSRKPRLRLVRIVLCSIWAPVALILIVILSGFTLDRYYTHPKLARDDYRGIAEFIASTAHPNDAILLVAPGQAEVFDYYYHGPLPIYPLPRQRPMDLEATATELAQLLARDKVYVVYWATAEADPDDFIQHWLNNRGYKTLDQWRGNVRLAVYVMPERRSPDGQVDSLNLSLGSDITLLGYRSGNVTLTAGEVTQLQLVWQARNKPAQRYKVFLQLLDARDQVIAQRDSEPVGDSRPTNTWEPGEVITDNHGVLIPPGTPPGAYRRIVGLYDRETGGRLRLPDGKDFVSLPMVRVTRSTTPPPLAALNMLHEQSFEFGAISLLGYDRYKRGFGHIPETPLVAGDRLHLTFYWQARVRPRADWWFDLTLSDDSGVAVASLRSPLVGDTYPTQLWSQREVVRGEHDLQLPATLPPGNYRLSLTMLPDDETEAGVAYLGAVNIAKPTK